MLCCALTALEASCFCAGANGLSITPRISNRGCFQLQSWAFQLCTVYCCCQAQVLLLKDIPICSSWHFCRMLSDGSYRSLIC